MRVLVTFQFIGEFESLQHALNLTSRFHNVVDYGGGQLDHRDLPRRNSVQWLATGARDVGTFLPSVEP